ncbi:MAG: AraC family transcriptional regulator, partial [Bacillota bacterium]|nr:AraC family transcriptional regulator [Bacillota bacterium]
MPDYLFNAKLLDKINHETAILPPAISFHCEQIQVSTSADLIDSLTQLAHKDAYRLVIPLNSTESLMIDGWLFVCQAGQALLMAPGQYSLYPGAPYCAAPDNSARIIILVYNQAIMEHLRENAGHDDKYADPKAVAARLLACNPCQICRKALYALLDACNDRRPGCQKAICLQAQAIALEIWRNDCSASVQGQQSMLMEEQPDALAENYKFMQRNLHEPLSLDQLAEMAGLSKTHYIRLFNRRFGKSPYQMLTLMRLQEAKILLEKCDLPIAEI